jgi:Ca2+-binding EF-hand superfamily protein
MIKMESETERSKQDLALKSDFNLFDAFKIFDKYSAGTIFRHEFEEGLEKLGIFSSKSQIALLFKKLDKDNNGRLRFGEFSDAFTPIDKLYRDHLEKK